MHYRFMDEAFFCASVDAPILLRTGEPVKSNGLIQIKKSKDDGWYSLSNCVLGFVGHIRVDTEFAHSLEKILEKDEDPDTYINALVFRLSDVVSIMNELKTALNYAHTEGQREMASKMRDLVDTPCGRLIH